MLHLVIIAVFHAIEGSFACRDLPVFRRIFFIRWGWLHYVLPWAAMVVYLFAAALEYHYPQASPINDTLIAQVLLA